MKTFDEIYTIVEESSHETAFNKEECAAIYNLLSQLSEKSFPAKIVEIGVEYGRSMTMFAEFVKQNPQWKLTVVDNWKQDNSEDARTHVFAQITKHGWVIDVWSRDSLKAADEYDEKIDVIHIDGDHTHNAVFADCEAWIPKVKVGGHVLFDDYGHDSLPGVYAAVTEYMEANKGQFKFLGRYGNKLGVFRRIK